MERGRALLSIYGNFITLFVTTFLLLSMITIESRSGYLRYNFSRKLSAELFNKQQFRLSAKLKDTPDNWIKANGVLSEMKLDYLAGHFDKTLVKYGLNQQAVVEQEMPFALKELAEAYLNFKVLDDSTRRQRKRLFLNILEESAIQNPHELFNWIKLNRAASTIQRFVSFMKEAVEWAILLGRAPFGERNPFIRMVQEARNLPKPQQKLREGIVLREGVDPDEFKDCRAYFAEEKGVIIQAFSESRYYFLVAFITFLFLTGCRPGEGCEIRWRDIFLDLESRTGKISFARSYDPLTQQVKGTKTGQRRKFPIRDPRLFDLLISIKPTDVKADDLVFTWSNGERINIGTLGKIWGATNYNGKPGIVLNLANEGKIRTYLKLYACRHTFITLQLAAGPKNIVIPLSQWVGNSPSTIYKYYADAPEDIFPVAV